MSTRTLTTEVEVTVTVSVTTPIGNDAKLGADIDRFARESKQKALDQVREGLQGFPAQAIHAVVQRVSLDVTADMNRR